jgi:hypothetical protein
MPLLETVGSSSARGLGMFGKFVLPFPSDISGLLFRLDASNESSFSLNGSSVNSWAATSGSGTFSQGNAAKKPLRQNASYGKTGVYFDGTDDTLISTSAFNPQYITAIFACQITLSGMMIELSPDANAGGFYLYNFGNSALVRTNGGTNTNGFNITPGWQDSTTPTTIMQRYDGTNHNVYKNNNELGSFSQNAGPMNQNSNLYLMSRGDSNIHAGGYLFEVLLYNRYLSNEEATRVHDYLQSKWAI